jgi:hypothetical protein
VLANWAKDAQVRWSKSLFGSAKQRSDHAHKYIYIYICIYVYIHTYGNKGTQFKEIYNKTNKKQAPLLQPSAREEGGGGGKQSKHVMEIEGRWET